MSSGTPLTRIDIEIFRADNGGHASGHANPYICDKDTIEYTCDGKTGSLTFDGYYYVEDHAPPYPEDATHYVSRYSDCLQKKHMMYVYHIENDVCKEEHWYLIEIYKRVTHKCTDRISENVCIDDDDDDDGELMNVCFFPTNLQTIYFNILETLPAGK